MSHSLSFRVPIWSLLGYPEVSTLDWFPVTAMPEVLDSNLSMSNAVAIGLILFCMGSFG